MTVTVTVTMPMTLPSVANGSHGHWSTRAKRVKAQRNYVKLALIDARVAAKVLVPGSHWVVPPMVVTLTRIAPRALDDDNLAYAFKAVRDEVAAYFGVNDNDPRIEWVYRQERGKPASVRLQFDVSTGGGA